MRPGIRNTAAALGFFLGLWLAVRYLLPLALPFLLGTGLALAAEPMVRFFRRQLRLPRAVASGIAVSAAFCFIALAALLLCALLLRELGALAGILPDLGDAAKSGVSALESWLLKMTSHSPKSLRPLLERSITGAFSDGTSLLDKGLGYLLNLAGTILSALPDSALGIGTSVISGYMISAKFPFLRRWVLRRFPREKLRPVLQTLKQLKTTVFHWLLAQLKLSGVTFCLLFLGFLLLRIPYAPVWALAVALLDAFPVLGTGTVLLPWCLISLLQGAGAKAAGLLGIYVTIAIVRSVLEPRLLGKHLGLDPLVTLMALYAGYKLFGLGGMILAPLVAVTAVQLLPGNTQTS